MIIELQPKKWRVPFYSVTCRKYDLTCISYLPPEQGIGIIPVSLQETGHPGSEVITAEYLDGTFANFTDIHSAINFHGGKIDEFTYSDDWGN